eukprot:CAMPEP_0184486468 /NCGR_PEP_ID=MMETSP0113_2-20130426/7958_1 /TAXON_ID=91329 /ORGANISM="Norrisiella sphaerica, Strain BC52" /LENGTH=397 /DNA_ID=CAMNT_0026868363 /DNA_START=219 /DNA_END=1412 /DNA_ORIENTATION=+
MSSSAYKSAECTEGVKVECSIPTSTCGRTKAEASEIALDRIKKAVTRSRGEKEGLFCKPELVQLIAATHLNTENENSPTPDLCSALPSRRRNSPVSKLRMYQKPPLNARYHQQMLAKKLKDDNACKITSNKIGIMPMDKNRLSQKVQRPQPSYPWEKSPRIVHKGFQPSKLKVIIRGLCKIQKPRSCPAFGSSNKKGYHFVPVENPTPGPADYEQKLIRPGTCTRFPTAPRFPKVRSSTAAVGTYDMQDKDNWCKAVSAPFRDGTLRTDQFKDDKDNPGPGYYDPGSMRLWRGSTPRRISIPAFSKAEPRFQWQREAESENLGPGRYHDGCQLPQHKKSFNVTMTREQNLGHIWKVRDCAEMLVPSQTVRPQIKASATSIERAKKKKGTEDQREKDL